MFFLKLFLKRLAHDTLMVVSNESCAQVYLGHAEEEEVVAAECVGESEGN